MQNKTLFLAIGLLMVWLTMAAEEGEVWEETDHEVLIRNERGAKNRESCRYSKGPWSPCDNKKNERSRTLTLKKGDPDVCEKNKTIQKRCKKACRYEKSTWSECSATGEMTRVDKLKPNSDAKCEQLRRITKKCNKDEQIKAAKDKACRYEKSTWSECSATGEMTRVDKLKPNSDAKCEQLRRITKKCNKNKPVKAAKDKGMSDETTTFPSNTDDCKALADY